MCLQIDNFIVIYNLTTILSIQRSRCSRELIFWSEPHCSPTPVHRELPGRTGRVGTVGSGVWLMFVVERMRGSAGCEVLYYFYWLDPWTTLLSVLNSIPRYAGMLMIAVIGLFAARART
jgi:hypothetical protein